MKVLYLYKGFFVCTNVTVKVLYLYKGFCDCISVTVSKVNMVLNVHRNNKAY